MRVLSFDPGYGRLGVAVIEKSDSKETLTYSSCFITSKEDSPEKRLLLVGREVERLIEKYLPGAVAMEKIFFTKNQKTAMKIAEVRGVIQERVAKNNLDLYEYGPTEIKTAITGYGKSDKHQVTDMVKKILKFDKRGALDDEFDAIAVGLTCFAYEKFK